MTMTNHNIQPHNFSQLEPPSAPDEASFQHQQHSPSPQSPSPCQQQQLHHINDDHHHHDDPTISHLDDQLHQSHHDHHHHHHDEPPSRKRQRHNLQDVSNKAITPSRASGRIRVKMEAAAAAAEQQKQQLQETCERQPSTAATKPPPPVPLKHRKRRAKNKQLNGDGHHELQIDVKRPNSVLVDTSIRALLTSFAFARLSPENQKILVESLPLVDRPATTDHQQLSLNPSSINNEFFNRACIEWRDRLAYGEFTNEHQTKLRAEQEREKSKIDPWKARNFEGIWGIKSSQRENLGEMLEKSAMEVKQQMEQGDFEIPAVYIDEMWKSEEAKDDNDDDDDDDNEKEDDGGCSGGSGGSGKGVEEETGGGDDDEVVDEEDEEEEDENDDDESDGEEAEPEEEEEFEKMVSFNVTAFLWRVTALRLI
jgi:hypothetical protein